MLDIRKSQYNSKNSHCYIGFSVVMTIPQFRYAQQLPLHKGAFGLYSYSPSPVREAFGLYSSSPSLVRGAFGLYSSLPPLPKGRWLAAGKTEGLIPINN